MSETFSVSRRRAAIAIAGTLALSARPLTAEAATITTGIAAKGNGRQICDDAHRNIARLLARVRHASGSSARKRAFERCTAAIRLHEYEQTALYVGRDSAEDEVRFLSTGLYRSADPTHLLARVIIRELDALPNTHAAWMNRFGDLETAFQNHIDESQSHVGRVDRISS